MLVPGVLVVKRFIQNTQFFLKKEGVRKEKTSCNTPVQKRRREEKKKHFINIFIKLIAF